MTGSDFVMVSEQAIGPNHLLREEVSRDSVSPATTRYSLQLPGVPIQTWTVPSEFFSAASRVDYVKAIRNILKHNVTISFSHDLVLEALLIAPAELVAVAPSGHRLWLLENGHPFGPLVTLTGNGIVGTWRIPKRDRYLLDEKYAHCSVGIPHQIFSDSYKKHCTVLESQWSSCLKGSQWLETSPIDPSKSWLAEITFIAEERGGEHSYKIKMSAQRGKSTAEWFVPFGDVTQKELLEYLELAWSSMRFGVKPTHELLRRELNKRNSENASKHVNCSTNDVARGGECVTVGSDRRASASSDDTCSILGSNQSGHHVGSPGAPWRGVGANAESPDSRFVRLVVGRYMIAIRESENGKGEFGASRIEANGSLGEIKAFTTVPNDPRALRLWQRIRRAGGALEDDPDAVVAAVDLIEAITGTECFVAWSGDKVFDGILPDNPSEDDLASGCNFWKPENHVDRVQTVDFHSDDLMRVVVKDGVMLVSQRHRIAQGVGDLGQGRKDAHILYHRLWKALRSNRGVRRLELVSGDPFVVGAESLTGGELFLLGEVVPEVNGVAVDAELYMRRDKDDWPLARAIQFLARNCLFAVGMPVPAYETVMPRADGSFVSGVKASHGPYAWRATVEVHPDSVWSWGRKQAIEQVSDAPRLLVEVTQGAVIAAAYQLGRVATDTIDAALKRHFGAKARPLCAALRTPWGEGLVMASAGLALRWLPGKTVAVRTVRDAVAPTMRQLAIAEGLDGVADAVASVVRRVVDGTPQELGIDAIVDVAVQRENPCRMRIAPVADEEEWSLSTTESCQAKRGA